MDLKKRPAEDILSLLKKKQRVGLKPAINLKLITGQRENLKKTRDLDELLSEPAKRSSDTGQWILCFNTCQ